MGSVAGDVADELDNGKVTTYGMVSWRAILTALLLIGVGFDCGIRQTKADPTALLRDSQRLLDQPSSGDTTTPSRLHRELDRTEEIGRADRNIVKRRLRLLEGRPSAQPSMPKSQPLSRPSLY